VFATIGDRARAIEPYELATERLPVADRYRADAFSSLAELLEAEGRQTEALAELERALRPETRVRSS
jgi:tetratricopeptide (TPR) repeat protein